MIGLVLLAEAWLCAGQSNMQQGWGMYNETPEEKARVAAELAQLDGLDVRIWDFNDRRWRRLDRTNALEKCAVGVSFAIRRARATGQRIDLYYVAAGGAPTEAFLSKRTMSAKRPDGGDLYPHLAAMVRDGRPIDANAAFPCAWCAQEYSKRKGCAGEGAWWDISRMYEDGISLLGDVPLDGILWYQGESNASTCVKPDTALDPQYVEETLRAVVSELRGDRKIPFLMFGLPIMNRPWETYRAAQRKVCAETGAVYLDTFGAGLGDPGNVHPRNKIPFAEMAADAARRILGPGAAAFVQPPVAGQVHASTLLPLGGDDFLAAWFQGTKEGAGDVAIWGARRTGGRWEAARLIAKVNPDAPHWNPVLRRGDDGRICLYFKVGRNCADWRTYLAESRDGGVSWDAPRELIAGECRGGRGPVRNKCLRLKSGRWLAPASREIGRWRAFVDRSDDDGRTWTASAEIAMPSEPKGAGVIQPTLWVGRDGTIRAYLRSNTGRIWESRSTDDGVTWSVAKPTALPNNNSGIDLAVAEDGALYLALNTTSGNWAKRSVLELWRSADDGATWTPFRTLEREENGEFSYPCVVAVPGGLALTYTWNRKRIAFVTCRRK